MEYFDGIKIGDEVWDFELGWGEIEEIWKEKGLIIVRFHKHDTFCHYDYNGKRFGDESRNQALFWDEIKFDIPKKNSRKVNY